MKWLYNMRIGTRLILGFIVVAIIAGVIGIIGIFSINNVDKLDSDMYAKMMVPMKDLIGMTQSYQSMRVNVRDAIITLDPAAETQDNKLFNTNSATFDSYLKDFTKTSTEKQLVKQLQDAKNEYTNYAKQVLSISLAGDDEEATAILYGQNTAKAVNNVDNALNKITTDNLSLAKSAEHSVSSTASGATGSSIIFIIIGMLLAIALGTFLSLMISRPVKKLAAAADKLALGNIDVDVKSTSGDEIGKLMDSFANMVKNTREQALYAQKIADGDMKFEIIENSTEDILAISMKQVVSSLRAVMADVRVLTGAAIEGRLSIRADATKHKGEYRKIVEGVNQTLDSVIDPLNVSADYVDKISKGNIPEKITDSYNGDFNVIKNNLNMCIDAVNSMIADTNMLTEAALDGKLEIRADASKHNGDFGKIVNGFNATLDAIITPLYEAEKVMKEMAVNDFTLEMNGSYKGVIKEFADSMNAVRARFLSLQDGFVRISKGDLSRLDEARGVGKRSENDQIVPALVATMEAVDNLINEVGILSNAAVSGDLSVRGDIEKFEGGYKDIINGFNNAMDAIVDPIQESLVVMQEIAKGNLTVNMDGNYQGDYAKIKEALNFVIESFNEVLNDINDAAEQVASGSGQVSDSAQALSQGSTEQASSVEELTATMEEIGAQTKQNAMNASEANELAQLAKDDAIKGNEQMNNMLMAMEDINEASTNISKIIKVIDEIAFQTNILALNAAVEAARAGQHGKGFAVVAEEVRNLAARSANAAKETTGLIEGSMKKVEGGSKIAKQTAAALNKIVTGVTQATALVADIASASNEQDSAINQVNKGIMQVSEVTQANSATSEESAAASEELTSQAELLKQMIGRFTLKGSSGFNENMNVKNLESSKMQSNGTKKGRAAAKPKRDEITKVRIALSEKEFGKY